MSYCILNFRITIKKKFDIYYIKITEKRIQLLRIRKREDLKRFVICIKLNFFR